MLKNFSKVLAPSALVYRHNILLSDERNLKYSYSRARTIGTNLYSVLVSKCVFSHKILSTNITKFARMFSAHAFGARGNNNIQCITLVRGTWKTSACEPVRLMISRARFWRCIFQAWALASEILNENTFYVLDRHYFWKVILETWLV